MGVIRCRDRVAAFVGFVYMRMSTTYAGKVYTIRKQIRLSRGTLLHTYLYMYTSYACVLYVYASTKNGGDRYLGYLSCALGVLYGVNTKKTKMKTSVHHVDLALTSGFHIWELTRVTRVT